MYNWSSACSSFNAIVVLSYFQANIKEYGGYDEPFDDYDDFM